MCGNFIILVIRAKHFLMFFFTQLDSGQSVTKTNAQAQCNCRIVEPQETLTVYWLNGFPVALVARAAVLQVASAQSIAMAAIKYRTSIEPKWFEQIW